jgi:hypothetical protein
LTKNEMCVIIKFSNSPKEDKMRKSVVSLGLVALVSACSTAQQIPATQSQAVPTPVVAPVVNRQEQSAQRAVEAIPDWFIDVPKSSDTIYSVGDGVSGSMSGALTNARANAFEGICQSAGGTVRSQTKIFRQDTEGSSNSMSTTAIRNLCPDVDVTGAVVEKRKVIQDGSRFRAYVLVALPLGDKNVLARTKQADKMQDRAMQSSGEAFKELDQLVDKPKAIQGPVSQNTVPTSNGELKMLDVDNAEYKARRDETLQKPGAVIGQTSLR